MKYIDSQLSEKEYGRRNMGTKSDPVRIVQIAGFQSSKEG